MPFTLNHKETGAMGNDKDMITSSGAVRVSDSPTPKFDDPEYDAVFGQRVEGRVDYRSVGW